MDARSEVLEGAERALVAAPGLEPPVLGFEVVALDADGRHGGLLEYRDLGGDYFTNRDPERQTKRLVAQLERLGHHMTLREGAAAA